MNQRLQLTAKQKIIFALIINFIIPLAGMSTDIYLPSLPALSHHFGVAKSLTQYTITAFVLAMGVAQLLAGPVSDAYGRKRLLQLAITTQLIAIIAILFSPSVYWMLAWRFIQGLGAAFMIVPNRAIINDVFEKHELKKHFNYITISFAAGPIVAPFIGGYLQHYFNWQANFIFIFAYAIIAFLLITFVYKESLPKAQKFSLHYLRASYNKILSNKHFLSFVGFGSLTLAYTVFFNITGPFIIQTTLHHSAVTYGHVALFMGLAWFLGNSTNRFVLNLNGQTKTKCILWLAAVITTTFLIVAHLQIFNLFSLAIPTFLLISLSGFIFPVYVGECLMMFDELAGSANACFFGISWLIFGALTFVASFIGTKSLVPVAIADTSISLLMLIIYYLVVARIWRNS